MISFNMIYSKSIHIPVYFVIHLSVEMNTISVCMCGKFASGIHCWWTSSLVPFPCYMGWSSRNHGRADSSMVGYSFFGYMSSEIAELYGIAIFLTDFHTALYNGYINLHTYQQWISVSILSVGIMLLCMCKDHPCIMLISVPLCLVTVLIVSPASVLCAHWSPFILWFVNKSWPANDWAGYIE